MKILRRHRAIYRGMPRDTGYLAVSAGVTAWRRDVARPPKRALIAHAHIATTITMAASDNPMPRPRPSCCSEVSICGRWGITGTGEYDAASEMAMLLAVVTGELRPAWIQADAVA